MKPKQCPYCGGLHTTDRMEERTVRYSNGTSQTAYTAYGWCNDCQRGFGLLRHVEQGQLGLA